MHDGPHDNAAGRPAGTDIATLDPGDAYKLLVGAVQPRPIAWVSTRSAAGVANLAPFSFFTVASRDPATILISLAGRPDGSPKDTLANVLATAELVVNIPSQRHLKAVSVSGTDVGPEVDEHALAEVATVPSHTLSVPRVSDVAIALECRLDRTISVGGDTLVLARVLHVHTAAGALDHRYRVDNDVLDPLGRLAGPWFTSVITRQPQPSAPTLAVAGD